MRSANPQEHGSLDNNLNIEHLDVPFWLAVWGLGFRVRV